MDFLDPTKVGWFYPELLEKYPVYCDGNSAEFGHMMYHVGTGPHYLMRWNPAFLAAVAHIAEGLVERLYIPYTGSSSFVYPYDLDDFKFDPPDGAPDCISWFTDPANRARLADAARFQPYEIWNALAEAVDWFSGRYGPEARIVDHNNAAYYWDVQRPFMEWAGRQYPPYTGWSTDGRSVTSGEDFPLWALTENGWCGGDSETSGVVYSLFTPLLRRMEDKLFRYFGKRIKLLVAVDLPGNNDIGFGSNAAESFRTAFGQPRPGGWVDNYSRYSNGVGDRLPTARVPLSLMYFERMLLGLNRHTWASGPLVFSHMHHLYEYLDEYDYGMGHPTTCGDLYRYNTGSYDHLEWLRKIKEEVPPEMTKSFSAKLEVYGWEQDWIDMITFPQVSGEVIANKDRHTVVQFSDSLLRAMLTDGWKTGNIRLSFPDESVWDGSGMSDSAVAEWLSLLHNYEGVGDPPVPPGTDATIYDAYGNPVVSRIISTVVCPVESNSDGDTHNASFCQDWPASEAVFRGLVDKIAIHTAAIAGYVSDEYGYFWCNNPETEVRERTFSAEVDVSSGGYDAGSGWHKELGAKLANVCLDAFDHFGNKDLKTQYRPIYNNLAKSDLVKISSNVPAGLPDDYVLIGWYDDGHPSFPVSVNLVPRSEIPNIQDQFKYFDPASCSDSCIWSGYGNYPTGEAPISVTFTYKFYNATVDQPAQTLVVKYAEEALMRASFLYKAMPTSS